MNNAFFIGRIVKDSETRYSQGENRTAISRFTLAVNRKFKKDGEADADFISCLAIGKLGEFFEKYGKKGVKFAIQSRVQTGSYINKDGIKVYTTDFIIESAEFAESKGTSESQPAPVADADGFSSIPEGIDEELPFANPNR